MDRGSLRPSADNWDIARLPLDAGHAGQAYWTETFAARALADALVAHDEFWEHVAEVRAGDAAIRDVAKRYVRRDQGGRAAVIAAYIERAAEAGENREFAKMAVWNTGVRSGWAVSAPLALGQPQRVLRSDAQETIARGALVVARRGARRCVEPSCDDGRGRPLSSDNRGDFCGAHASLLRRPREFDEAERALFDSAIPAVLGGESRPRARRIKRAG